MKRRDFVGTLAAATVGAGPYMHLAAGAAPARERARAGEHTFKLNYAPHFGMFKHTAGDDVIDQLKFMADQGFTALEDNGMKNRPVDVQERIAAEMSRLGMAMGVFVAHTIYWNEPNLANGDAALREQFLKEVRESVEVARRVNATWITVVPGHKDFKLAMGFQTANVIESLKRAAEILEPHNLVMVLEPLNPYRDHPGLFLSEIPQAYALCKAVASPACKILFDIYHQQITEGNLIPNIDASWDEVAYFQIGDNPGRNEPTTGEINYRNIFRHIHEKGYQGILGMEHGNAKPGAAGEQAVIEAYVAVDDFL